MKQIHILTGALVILAAGCTAGVQPQYRCPNPDGVTPQQVLEKFYGFDEPEELLMDPLIAGGDLAVPLVIKEIQQKNMVKRVYAMHFLGNGGFVEALPMLVSIAENDAEEDYFRAAALDAIFMLDENKASELADKYRTKKDELGKRATWLLDGTYSPTRRTCRQVYYKAKY